MWSVDRDLRFNHVVGRPALTSSFETSKIVGATLEEFLGTTDPTNTALACHRAAIAGHSTSFQYDFQDRIYDVHLEPTRDDQGNIDGACGVAIDATSRVRAARELRRTVSLLRATLEATDDGILVVDRQGRIAAHNQRFVDLWGIPERLLSRRDDNELLAFVEEQVADVDEFRRRVHELYRDPKQSSFDVIRFNDGRTISRHSLPQRIGDEIVGRVWSFRDVTAREDLLRCAMFLANASRLLASLEVENALATVAQLAVPELGDACAIDLFGDPPRRLMEIAREGLSIPALPRSLFSGRSVISHKGRGAHLAVPLIAHGEILGAITLVTERRHFHDDKLIEVTEDLAGRAAMAVETAAVFRQAKEALSARDELLSVAAHEIRGPATSINLAAQSLQKRHPDDKVQAHLLGIIERENRRLAGFVDDMLDVGRIRTGALRFDLATVDLVEVVHQVALRLGPEISHAGSHLSLSTDAAVVGVWDPTRLDQVVSNLLTNAIRFGRGSDIEITVRAAGDHAILAVRDHGVGIPKEAQERIFERYHRGSAGRHYGGLGLGLYIVRNIVEGLGGQVSVASEPDKGATFTVTLPLAKR